MDDLIARWVVGRRTGETDAEDRELVEPTIETEQMSVDGVLRRLRTTLLEEDVVAITIQIGEYDLVSERVRAETHI